MPTDRAMMAFRRQFFGGCDLDGGMDLLYMRFKRKINSLLDNNRLTLIAIPRRIIIW
jgi:hypothetical protein